MYRSRFKLKKKCLRTNILYISKIKIRYLKLTFCFTILLSVSYLWCNCERVILSLFLSLSNLSMCATSALALYRNGKKNSSALRQIFFSINLWSLNISDVITPVVRHSDHESYPQLAATNQFWRVGFYEARSGEFFRLSWGHPPLINHEVFEQQTRQAGRQVGRPFLSGVSQAARLE